MRKNHGFTLIEVMVVLSILALIAILAYNFFGGTMKEAKTKQLVTKVYNSLRIASDAYDLHVIRGGTEPAAGYVSGSHVLVTSGILKSAPSFSSSDLSAGAPEMWLGSDYGDFGGPSAANDLVIETYAFSDDVCKAFNDTYTNLGAVILDYQALGNTFPQNVPVFCMKWATADVNRGDFFMVNEFR